MDNMTTERIEYLAHPYEQKRLLTLPFELTPDVERLEISYRFADGNAVDLGLKVGEELLGWSGGARRQIVVSETFATPGYRRGALPHGRGYVLLGLHKITTVCHIHVEIVRYHKTERWLRGDTHLHSEHSDGKLSISELIARARTHNHDFLCFTDHNTVTQNREIDGINTALSLIPGMELTTQLGHVNFVGVAEPVFSFLPCATEVDITLKIAEARSNGAWIGINHPFCQHCPWLLPFINYDWLELWNGPWEATTHNEATFQYWLQKLREGQNIAVTSGSDFHKEKQFTLPTLNVRSRSHERDDILRAIANGQSYMQSHDDIQLRQFTAGEAGPGETSTSLTLHLDLNVPTHHQVLLYTQHQVYELPHRGGVVKQDIRWANSRFAFLRVNDGHSAQLITNPIFRE
ncbi:MULTISPECIES: CehA/McbA family metallohydrolase [Kluyvera]|uniref:CehA/McbA family metallohydrolase n=1 Tax=Kluyvera TaxID=579 RepID=UPI00200F31A0|nr:CehA/McbA family metallohydrolase [Kluyvera ascorbata]